MFFNYLFIFMVGSICGFFLELFYRKIVIKKWIKPGVFYGPYLPLYGMGLCISYFVYNLDINIIFKVLISIFLLTLIELLCGCIFIKYFKISLWDYRDNFMNYKGLICLKFSVYWGIIDLFFISVVFPICNISLFGFKWMKYVLYIFYSILISDIAYTLFYLIYIKNK